MTNDSFFTNCVPLEDELISLPPSLAVLVNVIIKIKVIEGRDVMGKLLLI